MKKKSISLARVLPVLLLCLLCLIPTAHADMGPKPEVTITVINAPEGELYLDLLAEGTPTEHPYPNSDSGIDPAILDNLRTLEGDGWVLAYSTGIANRAPVFGSLLPREDGTWRYSYTGLPETFRIAAATADAAQAAGTPYTREFFSSIVYDWETNTVRETSPAPLRFFARLASTLIPTLIVEGVLLWLFGFREKRSWLVFLIVNTVTQIGLHLACSALFPMAGTHPLFYVLILAVPELIICAVEAIAYALLLQERTAGRRVGYAFCANIASFVLGYIPLHLLLLLTILNR